MKYRQMVMKTHGVNMGAIGAILKNKLPPRASASDLHQSKPPPHNRPLVA